MGVQIRSGPVVAVNHGTGVQAPSSSVLTIGDENNDKWKGLVKPVGGHQSNQRVRRCVGLVTAARKLGYVHRTH